MKTEFEELLGEFSGNHPAPEDTLSAVEAKLGRKLPDDFRELLKISNGGEGSLGMEYLMIWSVEELVEYNAQYDVDKYAPGLLVFGSSGGGEAYAFDYRSGECRGVVRVPFVGMDLEYVREIAPTFVGFLKKLQNEQPL